MRYLFLLSLLNLGAARAVAEVDLKSIHKILILGDSITHHSPAPEIGWTGDWGMAATAADKDYVHLFLAQLAAAGGASAAAPDVWIFGEGGGKIADKLPFTDKITAYHADLALVQLGENDNKDVTVEGFQQPYEKLLAAIRAGNPHAIILCAGVWGMWPGTDHPKDRMIMAACQKYGASFADLGAAFADTGNRALSENRFTNVAVNWHPGDGGMAAYAEAFYKALTVAPSAPVGPPPAAKPVAIDETWGEPPSLVWSPVPPISQDAGRNVATVSANDAAKGAMFGTPLSVWKISGREIEIRTRVRADSVSEKPKPWDGVKLMLRIRNAEGNLDYPQFRLPTGTFPWTDVDWTVRIPDNAVEVDLSIGLANVTGAAWFDAIHISTKNVP